MLMGALGLLCKNMHSAANVRVQGRQQRRPLAVPQRQQKQRGRGGRSWWPPEVILLPPYLTSHRSHTASSSQRRSRRCLMSLLTRPCTATLSGKPSHSRFCLGMLHNNKWIYLSKNQSGTRCHLVTRVQKPISCTQCHCLFVQSKGGWAAIDAGQHRQVCQVGWVPDQAIQRGAPSQACCFQRGAVHIPCADAAPCYRMLPESARTPSIVILTVDVMVRRQCWRRISRRRWSAGRRSWGPMR